MFPTQKHHSTKVSLVSQLWQLILHLFCTFSGSAYNLFLPFTGGLFFRTFGRREVHSNGQWTLMVLHNPLLPNVTPVVLSLTWRHQHL